MFACRVCLYRLLFYRTTPYLSYLPLQTDAVWDCARSDCYFYRLLLVQIVARFRLAIFSLLLLGHCCLLSAGCLVRLDPSLVHTYCVLVQVPIVVCGGQVWRVVSVNFHCIAFVDLSYQQFLAILLNQVFSQRSFRVRKDRFWVVTLLLLLAA